MQFHPPIHQARIRHASFLLRTVPAEVVLHRQLQTAKYKLKGEGSAKQCNLFIQFQNAIIQRD